MAVILIQRARFAETTSDAIRFRHRIGALQAGPLNDTENAIDTYYEILDFDANEKSAIGALEHLLEEKERWSDLQDILIRRLGFAESDVAKISIYLRMADLYEKKRMLKV